MDLETANAHVISTQTEAAEALQRAQNVQTQAIIQGVKEALTYEGDDRPALVARIPVICNDIRDIKNDLKWIKWLGYGIVGGIGLIALKALSGV